MAALVLAAAYAGSDLCNRAGCVGCVATDPGHDGAPRAQEPDPPRALRADPIAGSAVAQLGVSGPRLRVGRAPHPTHASGPAAGVQAPPGAEPSVPVGPGCRAPRNERHLADAVDPVAGLVESGLAAAATRRQSGAARHRADRTGDLDATGRDGESHDGVRHDGRRQDATGTGHHRSGHQARRRGGRLRSEGRRGLVAWHVCRCGAGRAGEGIPGVPFGLPRHLGALQPDRQFRTDHRGGHARHGLAARRRPVSRVQGVRLALRECDRPGDGRDWREARLPQNLPLRREHRPARESLPGTASEPGSARLGGRVRSHPDTRHERCAGQGREEWTRRRRHHADAVFSQPRASGSDRRCFDQHLEQRSDVL